MAMMRALIGGLLAGAVAAVGWAYLVYFTGYELGIAAWFVGIIVGFCTSLSVAGRANSVSGAVAAIIAIGAVVGGKFGTAYLVSQEEVTELQTLAASDEFLISWVATDVSREFQDAGEKMIYPPNANIQDPTGKADFPAEVWSAATSRWDAFTDAERTEYRDFAHQASAMASCALPTIAFVTSLSLYDGLWLMLALGSAFKLGSTRFLSSGGPLEIDAEQASKELSAFYIPVPEDCEDVNAVRNAKMEEQRAVPAA